MLPLQCWSVGRNFELLCWDKWVRLTRARCSKRTKSFLVRPYLTPSVATTVFIFSLSTHTLGTADVNHMLPLNGLLFC